MLGCGWKEEGDGNRERERREERGLGKRKGGKGDVWLGDRIGGGRTESGRPSMARKEVPGWGVDIFCLIWKSLGCVDVGLGIV